MKSGQFAVTIYTTSTPRVSSRRFARQLIYKETDRNFEKVMAGNNSMDYIKPGPVQQEVASTQLELSPAAPFPTGEFDITIHKSTSYFNSPASGAGSIRRT